MLSNVTPTLISVIIPAYNHEAYVEEAILSVLHQEDVNMEVIVIDDGSKDGTMEVISRLHDSRLRVYHQPNQGSHRTINRGLELATGDYLAILNSDDRFPPQRLKRLLETSNNNDLDVVVTGLRLIDAAGVVITDPAHWWLRWYASLKTHHLTVQDPARSLLRGNWGVTTSNFFIKRKVYSTLGGLRPFKYVLDYEYLLRVATTPGLKLGFLIDEPLLDYRLHGTNTIRENPLRANLETDFILRRYMARIFGPPINPGLAHLRRIRRHVVALDRHNQGQKRLIASELNPHETQLQQLRGLLAHTQAELKITKQSRPYRWGQLLRRQINILRWMRSRLGTILDVGRWWGDYQVTRQILRVKTITQLHNLIDTQLDGIKLVSFDVFDTLIERVIDPPDHVKLISGRTLARHLQVHLGRLWTLPELLALRADVEARLRREAQAKFRDHECRFSDLASEMARLLTGKPNPELTAWIIAEELRAEMDCLYVKPGMITVLEDLRQRGLRIIAVSDMYLDQAHIETLLERLGLNKFIDQLYLSSETGIGKYSGRLFQHVLEAEGITVSSILHIGDNHHSDVMMPISLGIRSIWLDDRVNNRRRMILRGHAWLAIQNHYWRGRYLLQLIAPEAKQGFAFDLGFSYLGPLFCTFIQGVIEQVRTHRIEKLFFLAREGELFMKLFDYLAPKLMDPDEIPTVAYLYISRKAVAPAVLATGLAYASSLAPLYDPKQRCITSLCRVFEIDPAVLTAVAARHGYTIEQPIHDWQTQHYRDFIEDPELQSIVKSCGKERWELLRDYLTQHGFFSAQRVGIVDIGWNGTSQRYLQDAYSGLPNYPHVFGLYFGAVHGIRQGFNPSFNTLFGLMYDVYRQNKLDNAVLRFEELFEEGARAAHATTIGYKRTQNGQVEPVFKDDTAPDRQEELLMNQQIELFQQGVLVFAERFVHAVRLTGYGFDDIRPFMMTLLERVVAQPTLQEAKTLIQMTHSEDFGSHAVMKFHNDRLHPWDLLTPHKLRKRLRHSNWLYGSGRLTRLPGINLVLRYLDLTWFQL